jgi:hypothetical protein
VPPMRNPDIEKHCSDLFKAPDLLRSETEGSSCICVESDVVKIQNAISTDRKLIGYGLKRWRYQA